MIIAVGVDLVDLKRIEAIADDRFVRRILADDEYVVYEAITDFSRRMSFVAGRFAAKEALFKVFPKQDGKTNYRDFSIINDSFGKPFVNTRLLAKGYAIHLSISHTESHAMAFVVYERMSHNSP